MKTIIILGLTLTLILPIAWAQETSQDEAPAVTTREMVDAQLMELKENMAISDYKWTQVEMILKSSIRERVAIAKRYGLGEGEAAYAALESKDKRTIKREMKQSRKFAESRMKRYLDKEEMKRFKSLQEDIHNQVLTRLD